MTTIAEIRARRAAITPWEWKAIVTEDGFAQIMSGDRCVHFTGDMENTTGQDHADEAFIAAAPADIDTLLAEIDQLNIIIQDRDKQIAADAETDQRRNETIAGLLEQLNARNATLDHLLATIDKLAYVIAMGRANHQATAQLRKEAPGRYWEEEKFVKLRDDMLERITAEVKQEFGL